ncbi:MAG: CHASE sensor domain-containing protein [Rheinheimera sp.]|nr:CHASE sensor domain-containing protein [Rheinheimera sp.]
MVALAATLLYEERSYQPKQAQEMASLARVMAEMSDAAVDFQDQALAQEYLNILRLYPQLHQAALLLPDGSVFASLQQGSGPFRSWPMPPYRAGYQHQQNYSVFLQPLKAADPASAHLYLEYHQPPLWQRLPQYSIMFAAIAVSLLVITLVLQSYTRSYLLRPLEDMTRFAREVSASEQYDQQIMLRSQDELGSWPWLLIS